MFRVSVAVDSRVCAWILVSWVCVYVRVCSGRAVCQAVALRYVCVWKWGEEEGIGSSVHRVVTRASGASVSLGPQGLASRWGLVPRTWWDGKGAHCPPSVDPEPPSS